MTLRSRLILAVSLVAAALLLYAAWNWSAPGLYLRAEHGSREALDRLARTNSPYAQGLLDRIARTPGLAPSQRAAAMSALVRNDQTQSSVCWDLDQGSGGLDAPGTLLLMQALRSRDAITRECVDILLHRFMNAGDHEDPSLEGNVQFLAQSESLQADVLRKNGSAVLLTLKNQYGLGTAWPNPENVQVIRGLHLSQACPLMNNAIPAMRASDSPFLNQYTNLSQEICRLHAGGIPVAPAIAPPRNPGQFMTLVPAPAK